MTKNVYYQRVTVPEAYVTKGRQRVKQFGTSVYLRNGDQFEIELFNPTTTKILAKIKLNGNYISSSGIVLRPGERVFLERYLDEAKKFLFETYEVNGADPNVRNAIQNNGDVEVEFYEQTQPSQYTVTVSPSWTWHDPYYYYASPTIFYTAGCTGPQGPAGTAGVKGRSSSQGIDGAQSAMFMSCDLGNADLQIGNADALSFAAPPSQPLETGRVEKGDYSGQGFTADTTLFNSWYTWKTTWKILPDSQRPIMKQDLVVYCSNCGAKRKKATHKFCPNCGNQF